MFTLAVVNTKGGSGKTTIATSLAAQFAQSGYRTGLADLDKQSSSLSWLERRGNHTQLKPIKGYDLTDDDAKEPKGLERLVVDGVAAMKRKLVESLILSADLVVVPVLPSAFDEDGTNRFLELLEKSKSSRKYADNLVFVGNRIKARTQTAERLEKFFLQIGHQPVARLRDSQIYANAAAEGLSLFDLPKAKAKAHLEDWQPLLNIITTRVK